MIITISNGWANGDWHLILIDLYHEQPSQKAEGVFGFNLGLFGFCVGVMFHYER